MRESRLDIPGVQVFRHPASATTRFTNLYEADGTRRQVVTATPTTSDVTGFVARARAGIARSVHLPSGVYLEYSGVAEGQAAAARQVLVNVAVAAVAIVALLLLAFGEAAPPRLSCRARRLHSPAAPLASR